MQQSIPTLLCMHASTGAELFLLLPPPQLGLQLESLLCSGLFSGLQLHEVSWACLGAQPVLDPSKLFSWLLGTVLPK